MSYSSLRYAFGDHHRAVLVGEANHRLHQILLDEVLVDAVDERHIELDEVRLEIRNRAKTRVAASRVVDGEAVPLVAKLLEGPPEFWIILDRRSLGDLDYHPRRILDVERLHVERRVGKIRRVDIHEQQLSVLEQLAHSLDRPLATEATQIPDQIRIRGDLEHDLGAAHAAHGAPGKSFVTEDFLAVGDDDWMVLDVEAAGAQCFPKIGDFPGFLPVLQALRGVGGFPDTTIDLPLEAELGIVNDEGPSHEDVEQRRDVFAVNALDLRRYLVLESGSQHGDLGVCRRGCVFLRDMEKHEVVIIREGDHQLR